MKIPPPPERLPPIASPADLEDAWRMLMGELGFARPQMYVLFLHDDGQPLFVTHLEELPARPTPLQVRQVVRMFRLVQAHTEGACAFLVCRPGSAALTPADRTWARALASVTRWPVHVATDEDVRVVAPDDLAQAG